MLLVRIEPALEHDLRPGGNRQIIQGTADHVQGPAHDRPGIVVLPDARGDLKTCHGKEKRVHAQTDGHRAAALPGPPLLQVEPSVFARLDVYRNALFVQYHHPVSAQINPP